MEVAEDDEDDAIMMGKPAEDHGPEEPIQQGLSSQQALDELIHDIHSALENSYNCVPDADGTPDNQENIEYVSAERRQSHWLPWCCRPHSIKAAFSLENENSLFPWTLLIAGLVHVVILVFCGEAVTQVRKSPI